MTKQVKADLSLLFVTFGWGASFMLTKISLGHLQTFNLLATRFLVAFLIAALVFIRQMIKIDKKSFGYGMGLGFILFVSYAFQTTGLNYTTASKSAFITGSAVVFVPIILTVLTRSKLEMKAYISVIMAFIGLGFLTLNGSISDVNIGDIYTLISAVIGACYLILVGKYTVKVESISFAITQIFSVGIFSLLFSFIIEKPIITKDTNTWICILLLSIICTAGAFIVQMMAQKYTSPTRTALIFTAEPVFAGLFGYFFFNEVLGLKGLFGALLILAGMLVAELDYKALSKELIRKIKVDRFIKEEIEITD
jgi:drug/metabolite transporter (DMT)-like permease